MNTNFISTFQTALKRLALISTIAVLAACAGNNTSSNRAVPDGYYKVRPGDTLTQIAKRYGQNVNTLVAWNNLPNASQIEVGQVLRVRRHVASRNTATQQRQATAVTPINRLSLQWPTDNASSSIIQRYNGTTSKGIDIAGTQGQQIRSAAAGTVIYVGEEVRGYGKLILISHNELHHYRLCPQRYAFSTKRSKSPKPAKLSLPWAAAIQTASSFILKFV